MQHLARQWRNAAATSGVKFLLLPHEDEHAAHEALQHHGKTARLRVVADQEWSKTAMHALTAEGGFTLHDHVGDGPTGGYMVSVTKGTEEVHDVAAMTPETIAAYRDKHAAQLADPDVFLGAWVYQGKAYLDISTHVQGKSQALALAKQHDQIGIYDLTSGSTILTATGEVDKAATLVLAVGTDDHAFFNAIRASAGLPPL